MNLTTIERQTLELLKEGPRRRSELPSFSAGVLYGLCGRRFVNVYGTSEFRLTDAGRAALAGEAGAIGPFVFPPPTPPGATERTYRQVGAAPSPDDPLASDVPDPEAWAALLASRITWAEEQQRRAAECRDWSRVDVCRGYVQALQWVSRLCTDAEFRRAAVSQAEGREPGR